jgi:hypothetical protein
LCVCVCTCVCVCVCVCDYRLLVHEFLTPYQFYSHLFGIMLGQYTAKPCANLICIFF